MKLVREILNFQRGQDRKKSLETGIYREIPIRGMDLETLPPGVYLAKTEEYFGKDYKENFYTLLEIDPSSETFNKISPWSDNIHQIMDIIGEPKDHYYKIDTIMWEKVEWWMRGERIETLQLVEPL